MHNKLITAILPKGAAGPTLEALKLELDVVASNINNARGVGRITPLRHRGFGEQTEKEIISVVVEAKRADEVFEFIYEHAQINRPHGGLIFMAALSHATRFTLPALPAEEA